MINLGKLTIKTRLRGGLGIIIAFMVVLISNRYLEFTKHKQQTRTDHQDKQRENPCLLKNIQNNVNTIDKSVLMICSCQMTPKEQSLNGKRLRTRG